MPVSLPMWPGLFTPAPAADLRTLRWRWMIVEGSIRREVSEIEYWSVLASCDRIEVARSPGEDVVTRFCYGTLLPG